MNRETIKALHDVKSMIVEQDTHALRQITARLTALEEQRETLLARIAANDIDGSVADALAIGRYRLLQKQHLVRLTKEIDVVAHEQRKAEKALTLSFAETRAIERLG